MNAVTKGMLWAYCHPWRFSVGALSVLVAMALVGVLTACGSNPGDPKTFVWE